MKLTWFGSTCFRVHIGGQVGVIDPDAAGVGVEPRELVSGADFVVSLGNALPVADGNGWRPRAAERLLEAGDGVRAAQVWSVGAGTVLVDADDDRPLLVVAGAVPVLGRWAGNAVIILAGNRLAARAVAALEAAGPRLLALAGSEAAVDEAFAAIRDRLDGTGLIALEPGLAVEA